MIETKYKPISYSFYDELKKIVAEKRQVKVEYYNESDNLTTLRSPLLKLYSDGKAEFIDLEENVSIRLDKLYGVDGKYLDDYEHRDYLASCDCSL